MDVDKDILNQLSQKSNDLTLFLESINNVILGDKFKSLDQFIEFMKKTYSSCCSFTTYKPSIFMQCNTCFKQKNACICMNCFSNGDHKGHDYYVSRLDAATCDCGDAMSMHQKGFCKNHTGNFDLSILQKNEKISIATVITALLSHPQYYTNVEVFKTINEKIASLIDCANPIMRCFSIIFNDFFDLDKTLEMITKDSSASFGNLISIAVKDEVFCINTIIPLYSGLIKLFDILISSDNYDLIENICSFDSSCFYQFFDENLAKYLIEKGLDWCAVSTEFFKKAIQAEVEDPYEMETVINWTCWYLLIAKAGISLESESANANKFYAFFAKETLQFEHDRTFSRQMGDKEEDDWHSSLLQVWYVSMKWFKPHPKYIPYSEDVMNVFEDYLEINPWESPEYYEQSIFDPKTIIPMMNMSRYFLIYNIIASENPKKTIEEYCTKKGYDNDMLIIHLITPLLRLFLAAKFARKFARNSDGVLYMLDDIITKGYVYLFNSIQSMVFLMDKPEKIINLIIKMGSIKKADGGYSKSRISDFILIVLALMQHITHKEYLTTQLSNILYEKPLPINKIPDKALNAFTMIAEPKDGSKNWVLKSEETTGIITIAGLSVPYNNFIDKFCRRHPGEFLRFRNLKLRFPVDNMIEPIKFVFDSYLEVEKQMKSAVILALTFLSQDYIGEEKTDIEIAKEFLSKLGYESDAANKLFGIDTDDQNKMTSKQKALEAKKRAIERLKTQIKDFGDELNELSGDEETDNICSICQMVTDEPLYYPIHPHMSLVPCKCNISEKPMFVITGCTHQLHDSCAHREINSDNLNRLTCPKDRSDFSALLPLYDQSLAKRPQQIKELEFNLSEGLVGSVVLNEIRRRRNPNFIKSEPPSKFMRALFCAAWASRAPSTVSLPIGDLITEMVSSENPFEAFDRAVKVLSPSDPLKRFEFLRQAAIVDIMILGRKERIDMIDNYCALSESFGVEVCGEAPILKPLELAPLPNNHADLFSLPSFKREWYDHCPKELSYDLLTGEFYDSSPISRESTAEHIVMFILSRVVSFPCVMGLTQSSSRLIVSCLYFGENHRFPQMNLDHEMPLYLDKEQYEAVCDSVATV